MKYQITQRPVTPLCPIFLQQEMVKTFSERSTDTMFPDCPNATPCQHGSLVPANAPTNQPQNNTSVLSGRRLWGDRWVHSDFTNCHMAR